MKHDTKTAAGQLQSADAYLDREIERAAGHWWCLACAGHTALYLAYLPTNEATGAGGLLCVVTDNSVNSALTRGLVLADPERLPLNVERDHIRARIRTIARRLPILPI